MEPLFQLLNSIKQLSPELVDYLNQHLQTKEVKAKDLLLKSGQICRNICFVEKGLFRCYYEKDGKEVCTWFMKEFDVIVSVTSFFTQEQSYENIQALEDSVVHYISRDELYSAYEKFPEFNYVGRELLTKYYLLSEERLVCIRNSTGIQKVAFLYKHYADLVERVEQQYLASYLDMTPEYFSTCKKAYLEMINKKK
jgi:CRP-like cAMP-binding protein